jgi:hypothetical protein
LSELVRIFNKEASSTLPPLALRMSVIICT